MKLVYQNMEIFFNFLPTSGHLHPLEVENCDSNSRLVAAEDGNVKSGLKGLTLWSLCTAILVFCNVIQNYAEVSIYRYEINHCRSDIITTIAMNQVQKHNRIQIIN